MSAGILRFLKKLGIVVMLLAVIDLAGGKILDHFGAKLEQSYTLNEATPGLLILGTSKALHQYVPAIFEEQLKLPAYNAGGDGQSILYAYALLRAISEKQRPEVVVLDLRPYEFYEKPLDYDRLSVLLPYYYDYDAVKEVVQLRGADEKIKTLSSLYRYNAVTLDIVTGNFREPDNENKGYIPAEGVYKDPAKAQGDAAQDRPELPPVPDAAEKDHARHGAAEPGSAEPSAAEPGSAEPGAAEPGSAEPGAATADQAAPAETDDDGSRTLDPVKIKYFEKFVETARSQGSRLYIFVSPLYNRASYRETMQIIDNICRREEVFFRDLSQDTTFLGNTAYFRDPGHLNAKGAEIYSRKIAEMISNEISAGEALAAEAEVTAAENRAADVHNAAAADTDGPAGKE